MYPRAGLGAGLLFLPTTNPCFMKLNSPNGLPSDCLLQRKATHISDPPRRWQVSVINLVIKLWKERITSRDKIYIRLKGIGLPSDGACKHLFTEAFSFSQSLLCYNSLQHCSMPGKLSARSFICREKASKNAWKACNLEMFKSLHPNRKETASGLCQKESHNCSVLPFPALLGNGT